MSDLKFIIRQINVEYFCDGVKKNTAGVVDCMKCKNILRSNNQCNLAHVNYCLIITSASLKKSFKSDVSNILLNPSKNFFVREILALKHLLFVFFVHMCCIFPPNVNVCSIAKESTQWNKLFNFPPESFYLYNVKLCF